MGEGCSTPLYDFALRAELGECDTCPQSNFSRPAHKKIIPLTLTLDPTIRIKKFVLAKFVHNFSLTYLKFLPTRYE